MILPSRKQIIAFGLALICLFWAGYMMIPIGHHLMDHGQPSSHAAQHSSVVCSWMCASSAFVQSPFQAMIQGNLLILFTLPALLTLLRSNLSSLQLRSRSPPPT